MAQALGENDDAEYFNGIYEKTKAAYLYLYTENGIIKSDRQCHYVRPVAHKLLGEKETEKATSALAELIQKNGNKIGTGFLTTCHILNVLTDNGYSALAYDLLLQREQPSWLFEVERGATTVWETWFAIRDGNEPRGSHNHYSFGAISEWMMSRVLGIRISDGKITIKPYTDPRLGHASGSYLSPLGKISSSWKYESDRIIFTFEIPSNNEASLTLPDGTQKTLIPGTHTFSIAR